MAEKDAFAERRRAHEDEYFRRKEQELIAKLREAAASEARRKELAEASGVADEAILRNLTDLGFTSDTVRVLHLLPLVYVAWADGSVSASERGLILETANAHHVEQGSPTEAVLLGWLDARPSQEFFDEALRVIRAMVDVTEAVAGAPANLVDLCTQVAEVSGRILGFGKVSSGEREAIRRIASEMERTHETAATNLVREV